MLGGDTATRLIDRIRSLFHYWFVQYNPLYFFSAFCVLLGTFLVSNGLEGIDWETGQVVLNTVIQSYEVMLIVGAALLFRVANKHRPAVILGIMEIVFLFDPTFRTETIATLGTAELMASALWVVLLILKLIALAWVFKLKLSLETFVIVALAAVGMAGTPLFLALTSIDKGIVHLGATWYGAGLVALFLWVDPRVESKFELDKWGQTVLQRATKAAWMIWAGFYLYHLVAWSIPSSITLTLPHFAPIILLLPFCFENEISVWASGLGAIALTSAEPLTVTPTAMIVSMVFVLHGWHGRRYRLFVGAVLAIYLAAWTVGWQDWPLPEPELWLTVATATGLLAVAWRYQLPSGLLGMVLTMLPLWKKLAPRDTLGWGILLLALGFLTLIVGVAVYWTQPRSQDS
jgi:hypothetical protein